MRRTTHTTIYALLLGTLLFVPLFVFAQEDGAVKLLADGLPGVQGGDLGGYLRGMFRLGLGIAVILAVLQIVLGGFQYMTTDAASGKEEGKDKIRSAIYGLILALATVLILQTINPDILDLNIDFGNAGGGSQQGGGQGDSGIVSPAEQAVRSALADAGIAINNGPCASGQTTGCTNVAGLPQATISSLIALKNNCNCSLTITGGTEGGHQTHGQGEPFVDLRKTNEFNRYIANTSSCAESTGAGNLYRVGSNNYVDEGSHWHACMGTNCRITGHSGTC